MKMNHFLYALTIGCMVAFPQVQAQGFDFTEEEVSGDQGYVFTDEDVAAADAVDKNRELQGMINDGAVFLSKNRKAYEAIVASSTNYCKGLLNLTKDNYYQATNYQSPANQLAAIISDLTGAKQFSPAAGSFLEGPLSRSTLEQAKRNLTPAQQKEILKNINRSELLAKFWTSRELAEAFQRHDDDWFETLQMTSRFDEYIRSRQTQDKTYAQFVKYFTERSAITGVLRLLQLSMESNFSGEKSYSQEWIKYFGTGSTPPTDKVDRFLSRVLFDDTSAYSGPQLMSSWGKDTSIERMFTYFTVRGGKAAFSTNTPAVLLREYMSYFKTWNEDMMQAVRDRASEHNEKVIDAVQASMVIETYTKEAGDDVTPVDGGYRQLVKSGLLDMLTKLHDMNEYIKEVMEYVKTSTNYISNSSQKNSDILQLLDKHVQAAKSHFRTAHRIHKQYARTGKYH